MVGTGGTEGWSRPGCAAVVGTGAVTFTSDDGQTLAPTAEKLQGIAYTSVVALDEPNTLLARHAGMVLRSEDAGCTWRSIGVVSEALVLVAAPGGRAYGYEPNADTNLLVRVEGEEITALSPISGLLGLAVDPQDRDHLRVGDNRGQLWESGDGGRSFVAIGDLAWSGSVPLVYDFAFDPRDLDHVVVGAARVGAAMSTDGGRVWTPSTGLSSTAGPVNAFSIAIAPADGDVVWIQGIDMAEADGGIPGGGRHVYRSTDGGLTFASVVTQSPDVTLVNGALLAPHPVDAGVLYFVFGSFFQDYGTDIYRYDDRTGAVTRTHNTYDDVSAIAFSPADPGLVYLGLAVEEISG